LEFSTQVRLRQGEDDVAWQVLARGPNSLASEDLGVLRDYFNLHEPLGKMCKTWAGKDARFKLISPYFPGDPLEICLISPYFPGDPLEICLISPYFPGDPLEICLISPYFPGESTQQVAGPLTMYVLGVHPQEKPPRAAPGGGGYIFACQNFASVAAAAVCQVI